MKALYINVQLAQQRTCRVALAFPQKCNPMHDKWQSSEKPASQTNWCLHCRGEGGALLSAFLFTFCCTNQSSWPLICPPCDKYTPQTPTKFCC
ncbi:hypothetical protein GDO78_001903 [Eleutherodactylus coqui]|uniref:Uncharacterized protein n=1 Tax=Eleutherodactylus coqui TaxID=57060 RepID=A0A8J6FV69_ELECQ|nr:hypothetical protein GDO78_001903 [Eleutherodactylus coqui]